MEVAPAAAATAPWSYGTCGTRWASTATRGDLEVDLDFRRAGPGHYVAQQATLPTPGDWTLRIEARVSDFDQYTTQLEVPVR